ncbi:MAG TPA: hypothetical protein VJ875_03970 [Pyrinomonadaceae bacterium]|nr:hypothetical protein [Pyrinomonadaceae bacterium]
MNTLFVILVVCAAILAALNILLLLMWMKGIGSLMFPFLRLVITIPMTVVVLSLFQVAVVVVAAIVDRHRGASTEFLMRSF